MQCERGTRDTCARSRVFPAARPFLTLTDCCATTSAEGHRSATEGTFGMFSSPMTAEELTPKLKAAVDATPKQEEAI